MVQGKPVPRSEPTSTVGPVVPVPQPVGYLHRGVIMCAPCFGLHRIELGPDTEPLYAELKVPVPTPANWADIVAKAHIMVSGRGYKCRTCNSTLSR